MAEFSNFGQPSRTKLVQTPSTGVSFIDYRAVDDLKRLMTPNGKIQSRKRTGFTAQEQSTLAQAIKRARFMGLLPYTSATL